MIMRYHYDLKEEDYDNVKCLTVKLYNRGEECQAKDILNLLRMVVIPRMQQGHIDERDGTFDTEREFEIL